MGYLWRKVFSSEEWVWGHWMSESQQRHTGLVKFSLSEAALTIGLCPLFQRLGPWSLPTFPLQLLLFLKWPGITPVIAHLIVELPQLVVVFCELHVLFVAVTHPTLWCTKISHFIVPEILSAREHFWSSIWAHGAQIYNPTHALINHILAKKRFPQMDSSLLFHSIYLR